MHEDSGSFVPHVKPSESPPELTVRALLLGCVLGIVFGAASTYLALRVGLTVSASVPIAVLAIAILRPRRGQRAILEHNVTQTVGSAGESVAAAVVFTVPALVLLGYPMEVGLTTLIALTGGLLGVLMMVPLRRYLIVKEHKTLRYPEGRAAAEILIAGEKGGMSARKIFVGMAAGAAFKLLYSPLAAVKGAAEATLGFFKGAMVSCDFEPALLGVGYIIGYRTSVIMVGGSVLAAFVLIPLIAFFGSHATEVLPPATVPIRDMDAWDIWKNYVRHIGAGAVATGGLFALIRALPAIVSSLGASSRSLFGGGRDDDGRATLRTDRDTPTPILLIGALAIVAFVWAVPTFEMNLTGAILILVLGFLFSVVSSRITGEVGSSSNPLSGMTIAVLMGTCGTFLLMGREGSEYARLAIVIGAVICITISNAGTCSQDLKTGYMVGGTPVRQQGALLIGVVSSVLAVGWTAYLLNEAATSETRLAQPFAVAQEVLDKRGTEVVSRTDDATYLFVGLKSEDLPTGVAAGNYLVDPATRQATWLREDGVSREKGGLNAPQARLMATVVDGLLNQDLPWNLILIGVAIALFIELMGFGSLTFAVGVYLPLASTLPVFLGGLVRRFADRRYRRKPDDETESQGTLFCSGVIAGASILAVLAAGLSLLPGAADSPPLALLGAIPRAFDSLFPHGGDLWTFLVLCSLGWWIFRAARDPQPR